jgi:CheY-specific phosphatase CheX
MPDNHAAAEVERLLREAARDVLETMFFATVAEGAVGEPLAEAHLATRLRFRGAPPGEFRLRISRDAAQAIATAFSGRENESDLAPGEVEQVLCELTNVICGAVLSRLEKDTTFELESPEALAPAPGEAPVSGVHCPLWLDCGRLDVWLRLETDS